MSGARPSIEFLRQLFTLTEGGHLLRRRRTSSRAPAGGIVGTTDSYGYRITHIGGKRQKVHRIVWAIVHGRWPEHEIDHINGVRDDNRPENLRECERLQNGKNLGVRRDSSSRVRGVFWDQANRKWRVRVRVDGKYVYGGRHECVRDAAIEVRALQKQHFGEFARTQ